MAIRCLNLTVPPEKRDYAIAEFNAKSAKVRIFMRGPHFFKYASLSPHKLPISVQNMRGLHNFIILAFSLQKKSHVS